eukprot:1626289-Pleurochrysis_carterae.AAC.10
MISNYDRQLMESVLKTIESVATCQTFRVSYGGSGRQLIWLLLAQAHYDNGLAENTLASFKTFNHEFDRYNRSVP